MFDKWMKGIKEVGFPIMVASALLLAGYLILQDYREMGRTLRDYIKASSKAQTDIASALQEQKAESRMIRRMLQRHFGEHPPHETSSVPVLPRNPQN